MTDKNTNQSSDITAQANQIVHNNMLAAAAASLVPLPLFDLAAIAGIQLNMLRNLAGLYEDVTFRDSLGRAAIAALIGGWVPTTAAGLLGSLVKGVPLVGPLVNFAGTSVLAGATTYAVGKVFIQHYASGGTFLTFDPDAVRDYYNSHYQAGKEIIRQAPRQP